ncbi:ATP-dependent acyl-CoA ligase [Mycolicibacterium smegmatis]|nr:ATP-dependent acyl-CoA ligase [Mycolicibacterium smegmatis]MBE9622073.1 ATP-dependent acyl-CoA ligase [Mycolicibacterium smegmatis]MBE9628417.1 ATP-dependent acyl-CoA ligase [Mycolicibacterium smegmatis]MBE9634882.1 ATP-dependent acyl-CoA ligase [Mycolicibacterium smegmatis]MBE9647026.1 ATP-dependent acyl-CoA ligase [Mycolicibacterium smegmatis]MBE9653504.1 ATP-dependent acyl-CoA ligase [Mycolicibacterium smegmatis]
MTSVDANSDAAVTHSYDPILVSYLSRAAARWPDRTWCITPREEISRADALRDGSRIAAGLIAKGVRKGDRVVLVAGNGLDFVRAWLGLILCGAVTVSINPKAVASELPAVIDEVRPALVLVEAGLEVGHVEHTPPGGQPVPVMFIDEAHAASDEAVVSLDRPPAGPDDPVSFIQSSGSTGKPKFVIETNRMYTMAGEGFAHWLGLDDEDVLLTTLPLSHLNAQAYSVLGSWGCGAKLVLLPRFSASSFWSDVAKYGATVFNAIGAMLEALMAQPPSVSQERARVRLCYSAPAPAPARHREIENRFGFRLVVGYALSETPYGLIVPVDEPTVYGSMGVPRQHPTLGAVNEVRVVDADGHEVADGTTGELELRNPAITPGYFGKTTESAAMRPGGWLRTGDLAVRRPDGHFFFGGRAKEVIRYKGENLSPAEVENAIGSHPAVRAVAVIGVPSALSEEDVKAFVQLRPGETASPTELAQWSATKLPPYKRPRYIELVTEFPLTDTQKIAKARLPRDRSTSEVDFAPRRDPRQDDRDT